MLSIQKYKIDYKGAVWIIFGLALAVRFVALVLSSLIPALQRYVFWGDAVGYTQLAVNLLTEGSFRFNGGEATAFRMPGYPFFLALTYATVGSPYITQLLQIIADLVVMLCTLRISEYLYKDRVVGLLAMAVIAFHPVFILSTVTLYAESLGVLFTTLALLILVKSDNSIKSGLLAGASLSAAIYLKTNLLIVALFMLLVVGLKWFSSQGIKGFFKSTVPAILMIGLVMFPWIVRNWMVMGAFIPTTTSNGVNMYRGNNPLADGGAASDQPYVLPGMSEVESSKEFSRQALEWIRANPLTFIQLFPAKAAHFVWLLALSASGTLQVNSVIFLFILILTVTFYGLVAVGGWMTYRLNLRWELALLLSPFITLLVLSLLSYGGVRFSLPAQPGLAILMSVGAMYLVRRKFPVPSGDILTHQANMNEFPG